MSHLIRSPRFALAAPILGALLLVSTACGDGGFEPVPREITDTIRFTSVASGARHSCGIGVDGLTYCWGYAGDGQVGWGRNGRITAASPVVSGVRFTEVTAGSQHSCGLDATGAVYCWGRGPWGFAFVPAEIQGTGGMRALSSTYAHVCTVTSGETAACFGSGYAGQLGPAVPAGEGRSTAAVTVPGLDEVTVVAPGKNFTCALTESGDAWCWGLHEGGQLGVGGSAAACSVAGVSEVPCSFDPVRVASSGPYTDLTAGLYHACGLLTSGSVECWGDDVSAQLGLDDGAADTCTWLAEVRGLERACELTPRLVDGGLTFTMVEAGFHHTCGITATASAYCWGSNGFGQIGSGSSSPGARPELVAGDHQWVSVHPGQVHTCGLAADGAAYCWGDGTWGQLGSFHELSPVPQLVRAAIAPVS